MKNENTKVWIWILYLNLRFFLSRCWFINRHFNCFLFIGNDNWTKRRILSMNNTVINRPKTMKLKSIFIPKFHQIISIKKQYLFYYHFVVFSISWSGILPTTWSIKSSLTSGLKIISNPKNHPISPFFPLQCF
jgi:hypothetical protein